MSNCKCALNCACRGDKPLPVHIAELMEILDEAKAGVIASRKLYEQAKAAVNTEALKLDKSKVYAVPGGVLMLDGRGFWSVRPLEMLCGS